MDEKFLCRGKHLKTGEWIKGFYIHGHDPTYCPIDDDNDEIYYVAPSKLVDLTAYCWVV